MGRLLFVASVYALGVAALIALATQSGFQDPTQLAALVVITALVVFTLGYFQDRANGRRGWDLYWPLIGLLGVLGTGTLMDFTNPFGTHRTKEEFLEALRSADVIVRDADSVDPLSGLHALYIEGLASGVHGGTVPYGTNAQAELAPQHMEHLLRQETAEQGDLVVELAPNGRSGARATISFDGATRSFRVRSYQLSKFTSQVLEVLGADFTPLASACLPEISERESEALNLALNHVSSRSADRSEEGIRLLRELVSPRADTPPYIRAHLALALAKHVAHRWAAPDGLLLEALRQADRSLVGECHDVFALPYRARGTILLVAMETAAHANWESDTARREFLDAARMTQESTLDEVKRGLLHRSLDDFEAHIQVANARSIKPDVEVVSTLLATLSRLAELEQRDEFCDLARQYFARVEDLQPTPVRAHVNFASAELVCARLTNDIPGINAAIDRLRNLPRIKSSGIVPYNLACALGTLATLGYETVEPQSDELFGSLEEAARHDDVAVRLRNLQKYLPEMLSSDPWPEHVDPDLKPIVRLDPDRFSRIILDATETIPTRSFYSARPLPRLSQQTGDSAGSRAKPRPEPKVEPQQQP